MTIYLHPESDQGLANAYREAFSNAIEIFAISAYLRDWECFETSSNCEAAILVVGKDFGITRKSALEKALDWKNYVGKKCHFYVVTEINGFHPKILLWKENRNRQTKHYLIIGSSNLTIAAFNSNYEANIRIGISEESYNKITNWIATILSFSRPVTKTWIDQYQEQNLPQSRKPQKQIRPDNITGLLLPEFPSLAVVLAQRREQVYAFDDIKVEFVRVVRECAQDGSQKSQREFYDWLINNWNGQDWKFQGNGVFRRDWQNTNWHLLCVALVNVLDCSANDRDRIVIDNYNTLESSNQVEVRKAVVTEMLCHFFPDLYPLWNTPVVTWLKNMNKWNASRSLSIGEKYIYLANTLRNALSENENYPARNLAELDHIIWAYCKYEGWT
jgi:hypothetical protein